MYKGWAEENSKEVWEGSWKKICMLENPADRRKMGYLRNID